MARAAGEADGDALARLAHALRGSGANLGAEAMSAACAALEEAVARGDLGAAAERLPGLRATFDATRAALTEAVRAEGA
jgi:HPt (histidine-containing phosphotransfer) domain-containing protein